MELILKSGPQIISREWEYDHVKGEGHYVESDITDRAAELLFFDIDLDDSVTLRDIFFLLAQNPILLQRQQR